MDGDDEDLLAGIIIRMWLESYYDLNTPVDDSDYPDDEDLLF